MPLNLIRRSRTRFTSFELSTATEKTRESDSESESDSVLFEGHIRTLAQVSAEPLPNRLQRQTGQRMASVPKTQVELADSLHAYPRPPRCVRGSVVLTC